MRLPILECQPGLYCRPTEDERGDGYRYRGRQDTLYLFETRDGKRELFARRRSFAGWQLQRGAFVFEFVRSVA
jgi:hypothetical protein